MGYSMPPETEDTNATPGKWQPPAETLPPLSELEAIATVRQSDVDNAVQQWKNDCPIEEFRDLVEAEQA